MKINRIKSKHPRLNKLKESVIGNIFYFIYLHWFVLISIIGLALSCFVLLFVAEMIFPEKVHMFGYGMTKRMFNELSTHKHYHAAAFVLEQNPEFLKESGDGVEYQMELSDVYRHIGEYNKAEKILLGLYEMDVESFSHFAQLDNKPDSEREIIIPMMQIGVGTALIDLYEDMGDYGRQKEYYQRTIKSLEKFKATDFTTLFNNLDEDAAEKFASIDFNNLYENSLLLRGLKVLYHESPQKAISELEKDINRITCNSDYNTQFKLKHISQLVEWKMANGQKVGVYPLLYNGADLCYSTKNLYDPAFEYAGVLAKTAFEIGDMETGYKLMRLYQHYLERNYAPGDVNRMKGNLLLCRYYDANGQIEKLTETVSSICSGMKGKITENFVGLNSEQREFLAAGLSESFDMAIEMAAKYKTPELANLCFDNLIFERGLLLRSDAAMRRSVELSSDPAIKEKYDTLVSMKRELVARNNLSNIGNKVRIIQLESKINEIDKDLASIPEYADAINLNLPSMNKIQKALNGKDYYVELSQRISSDNDTLLYAILLPPVGDASLIDLQSIDAVSSTLKRRINDIYTDQGLTQKIMGPLLAQIPEGRNINYSVSGVFSQIAVPSLCVSFSDNRYLSDVYSFKLYSSPERLVVKERQSPLLAKSVTASIWGGIDYGQIPTKDSLDIELKRGIRRGEPLAQLPGSSREVSSIESLLKSHGLKVSMHISNHATKTAFLKDKANILHISTHGAFGVSSNKNPLETSYLFFSNANRSWTMPTPSAIDEIGVVNGVDISGMSLSNCSLVTLSACETGLGHSDTREGVFGLQRAFKLAGAKKILMSMWSVSDAVTADFMTSFYTHLLEDSGKDIDQALLKAQRDIRRTHPMPSDWGAFVVLD